jgi:hypothetical protein
MMNLALTIEPHDCVLAIVGSRDIPRYAAESLIREAILAHKPKMVVSGGARGIDSYAAEIAEESGLSVIEFVPKFMRWEAPETGEPEETLVGSRMRMTVPGGFKSRNAAVAEACTCLVRIYSPTTKTYGSGWTADHAELLGKRVTRHLVGG